MWPLATCIPNGTSFNAKTQMEFDFYYQVDTKVSIHFKVSYDPDPIGGNTQKEYEDKVQENFKKVEPWCWIEEVGLISKFIFWNFGHYEMMFDNCVKEELSNKKVGIFFSFMILDSSSGICDMVFGRAKWL